MSCLRCDRCGHEPRVFAGPDAILNYKTGEGCEATAEGGERCAGSYETAKKFQPAAGGSGYAREEWAAYWRSLTKGERESLKAKARWEAISLSRVAIEWGAVEERAVLS